MKSPLGTPINFAHPLAKGLVGCWLMNEGSGNKIYDLSGNGNDGTFVNHTAWVPGRTGPALTFDGVDDHVVVPNKASLNPISALTISVWVNQKATSVGQSANISNIAGKTSSSYGYELRLTSDVLYFLIEQGGWIGLSGNTLNLNQWYHIVGTYDKSNMKLFVDGGLVNSLAESADIRVDTGSFYVGSRTASARYFNGLIDDVRIYNRALSEQEVQQLYLNPYAMFEQYPVWRDYVAAAVGNRRRRLLLTRRAA